MKISASIQVIRSRLASSIRVTGFLNDSEDIVSIIIFTCVFDFYMPTDSIHWVYTVMLAR